MEYDIEIITSVCNKYLDRVNHFKKHGLVNVKDKKVLLNVIVSNEDIQDIESGWPESITVNIIKKQSHDFVKNVYEFLSQFDATNLRSKWLMKVDDDSSTDISTLLYNLDKFYDWKEPYYLAAEPVKFCPSNIESMPLEEYSPYLQDYRRLVHNLYHEIECFVVSHAALVKIFQNKDSVKLLKKRSEIEGGATDVVFAFAANISKIYPIDCPFLTPWPFVEQFSLIGGVKNHVHLVTKNQPGENFEERLDDLSYVFFQKILENKHSELESNLIGRKFILETDYELKLYEFCDLFWLRIKFHEPMNWFEHQGYIYVLQNRNVFMKLQFRDSELIGDDIVLRPVMKK